MRFLKFLSKSKPEVDNGQPVIRASVITDGTSAENYDGGKFPGGFGDTKIFWNDLPTLRARSAQLFKENLYAKGLLRRLITNEINAGLTPEIIPNESLLGVPEGSLGDWSEYAEDLFSVWSDSSALCDTTLQSNFSNLQRIVRRESLIAGDVLVVLRIDRVTGLPRVQIISGENVISPIANADLQSGNRVVDGVEVNNFNQHVAYYVLQLDNTVIRIPAIGAKSKRRVAWLVYGIEKRLGEVRGDPLLSVILQSLKEIDRYRDATQRKAAINAILAMFIKKTQDKIGVTPITAGAVRKKSATVADSSGETRKYNIAQHIPGLVLETLQYGEEPVAFGNQGIDTKFAEFESALIQAIAWANEIPPEIMQLAFSNNYSASQAAINEFKNYLNKMRSEFGANFCRPVYIEWLLSSVLKQKIAAPGLLESWRDKTQYDILGAWVMVEWSGAIKPSTDIKKQAEGYERMVSAGWMTNDRAAKELTGTKYSRNIRTIKRENEMRAEAGMQALGSTSPAAYPQQDAENEETDEEETD